jgi:hypothetical protein
MISILLLTMFLIGTLLTFYMLHKRYKRIRIIIIAAIYVFVTDCIVSLYLMSLHNSMSITNFIVYVGIYIDALISLIVVYLIFFIMYTLKRPNRKNLDHFIIKNPKFTIFKLLCISCAAINLLINKTISLKLKLIGICGIALLILIEISLTTLSRIAKRRVL